MIPHVSFAHAVVAFRTVVFDVDHSLQAKTQANHTPKLLNPKTVISNAKGVLIIDMVINDFHRLHTYHIV